MIFKLFFKMEKETLNFKKKIISKNNKISLASPDITDHEIKAVISVLRTPRLSLGPKLIEFENKIAKYAGVKYAIAVNSGTSALHLIVEALGIKEGDEVITTPFSFVASSNCLLFRNAKPVFVDIDPMTLTLDVEKVEEKITKYTKAILAVDIFGYPCDWDRLRKIARKYQLFLIEDSAEALGSEYKGRKAGSLGDAGIFSFYPNKQITTGEGGVVVTNNFQIAKICRSLRDQGRNSKKGWLIYKRLGYNYRLSEINCALGSAQMDRINGIIEKRTRVAHWYNELLKDIPEVKIPPIIIPNIKLSLFVYVIRLGDKYDRKRRDKIIRGLNARGIESKGYFPPIHLQPFYRKRFGYKPGNFPITEYISDRTIALPFHSRLTKSEVKRVVDVLKSLL
jgi:perosamine synthetase